MKGEFKYATKFYFVECAKPHLIFDGFYQDEKELRLLQNL